MKKTKSVITEYEGYCIFCGAPTNTEHHLIFGGALRTLADEDGLKAPVCDNHHNMNPLKERIHDNPIAEALSKITGQLAYEKTKVADGYSQDHARESFRKRYGRSYL